MTLAIVVVTELVTPAVVVIVLVLVLVLDNSKSLNRSQLPNPDHHPGDHTLQHPRVLQRMEFRVVEKPNDKKRPP